MTGFASITFAPMVSWWVILALASVAALLVLYGLWQRIPGTVWRMAAFAALIGLLSDPSLVSEERQMHPDVGVIVVDESASQSIGERQIVTEQAVEHLLKQAENAKDLELRIVRVDGKGDREDGTRLLNALERSLSDVSPKRVAGAVLVTDGQVHDLDTNLRDAIAPVHVLLSGNTSEKDRRLVVVQAPRYGIVGEKLTVTVRVVDQGYGDDARRARVSVRRPDGSAQSYDMRVGRDHKIPLTLEHAGPSVVELAVEAAEDELTLRNNRAVVVTNGVRDRLRVLLVSGKPHSGERTWRNLLKADPSVDLVHFTILRPPEKQDGTPINELSLIAFPIRELFEVKLDEFDLIIFDRYHRRGVLPSVYLDNIADFVREGGALLEAAGPAFASPLSLYRTPLESVLPGRPSGNVFESGFRPALTDAGYRHPVTTDLQGAGNAGDVSPTWGRWFRMIEAEATSGNALMKGIGEKPVLILDRVGEGRVAQLLSDQSWLWARGFEGGGPQSELLRRLAHWLMKEPDLEEDRLSATVHGDEIRIERRSLLEQTSDVTVTGPREQTWSVALKTEAPGRSAGSLTVTEPGIYRLSDGKFTTVAAVGGLNPLEFQDVRTTDTKLGPVAEETGGGVIWLSETGLPDLRRVRPGRDAAGRSWIGFKANKDYLVTGVRQIDLLPPLVVLLITLGTLIFGWRREGR